MNRCFSASGSNRCLGAVLATFGPFGRKSQQPQDSIPHQRCRQLIGFVVSFNRRPKLAITASRHIGPLLLSDYIGRRPKFANTNLEVFNLADSDTPSQFAAYEWKNRRQSHIRRLAPPRKTNT